jgi:hypothetical protein
LEEEEWTARRMFCHSESRGRSLPACLPDAEVIRRRSFEGSAGIVAVVGCMRQDGCGSRVLKELKCSAYTRQMETRLDVTFLRSYVVYVSDLSIGYLGIGAALTGRVYGIVQGHNRTVVSSSHRLCCPDILQFPKRAPNWSKDTFVVYARPIVEQ